MRKFIHRHSPRPSAKAAFLAGLGAMVAILILEAVQTSSAAIWLIAPFGATCALVFGLPALSASQPINVVGGHVVSAAVGLGVSSLAALGGMPESIAIGGAVGLAIAAMMALRIMHPPAGATAMTVVLTGAGWPFLFVPAFAGSAALVAVGVLWHKANSVPYPVPIEKS